MQKNLLSAARLFALGAGLMFGTAGAGHAQTGDTRAFGMLALNGFSASTYDSLLADYTRQNVVDSYDTFVNEFIDVDLDRVDMTGALPDEVYAERLKMMATEVQLPYNDVVKKYIQIYTRKGGVMERVLGLAQYYFPIFEEALYRYKLPMELKMLPVIESALIPRAESRAAAVGLWQFMLRTGKYYGLEINSFVDERCDPVKSTEAACKYLKDMYKIYGDWTLVIASYNCGAGNVNKALERFRSAHGGADAKTYWDIYEYLPRETRGYIPAFIAATYAYTYYKAHDLNPTIPWHPLATDTVHVNRMLHLEQVATTLNIPIEVLRGLNPQYTVDVIPAKNQTYALTLPQEYMTSFVRESPEIYGKDSLYLAKYLNISNLSQEQLTAGSSRGGSVSAKGTKITYKIKSGDILGRIAARYHVTVKQLMSWNNIKNAKTLRPGQTLVIYRK
ncbi:lytic transglycosylase domain-containing protein [Rikenella microfusus]|uniref:lytic transglycosylase domain-containing protein n=1 Tax=Rikenella microfusus TaxID=28139 RepID=UPI001D4C9089|nr:lytic transglycosylase domain-containing protein [Rikenella microfusus]HJE88803.1 transglycosylase SLT domain-containing protein [Rikenella microfusus]